MMDKQKSQCFNFMQILKHFFQYASKNFQRNIILNSLSLKSNISSWLQNLSPAIHVTYTKFCKALLYFTNRNVLMNGNLRISDYILNKIQFNEFSWISPVSCTVLKSISKLSIAHKWKKSKILVIKSPEHNSLNTRAWFIYLPLVFNVFVDTDSYANCHQSIVPARYKHQSDAQG